jgi:hypothetical protein
MKRKIILLAALTALVVIVGYSSMTFGIGDKCLTVNAIGCMKIGDKCLMVCDITLDPAYRSHGDVPIMVVKEHGSQTVVSTDQMDFVGNVGGCDEYEGRPEIPCNEPYDVLVYINDTSGLPIIVEQSIVCP